MPCLIFILLLSSLTIDLSSSNQPLWSCHYPCCNDEIIACCSKLAIRIVLSADGLVCYPSEGKCQGMYPQTARAYAVSVVQLKRPSSMALLYSLWGQSCKQAGFQMPCVSVRVQVHSLPHYCTKKSPWMCLLSFSDEVLDPHQDTVFLWIHALPLEKLLFLSVHLFTCLIFFFFLSVLSVLTANVVRLRLSPRSICTTLSMMRYPGPTSAVWVSECISWKNRALQGITHCPPFWIGPF